MGKSKRKQESKEEILENGQDEIEKKETDKPKQKKMKKHSESNSEDKSSEVITNPEGKKIKKKKKKTETENSENSEDTKFVIIYLKSSKLFYQIFVMYFIFLFCFSEDNQEEANTEEKEPSKTAKKEISKRQQKKAKQLAREEAMKVEAHKSYAAKAMNYVSKVRRQKFYTKLKIVLQVNINCIFYYSGNMQKATGNLKNFVNSG